MAFGTGYVETFNSVHIPLLEKALKRIGIPIQFIEIILFILSNQKSQVIMDMGKTDLYDIQDGTDQGKPFLPCYGGYITTH